MPSIIERKKTVFLSIYRKENDEIFKSLKEADE